MWFSYLNTYLVENIAFSRKKALLFLFRLVGGGVVKARQKLISIVISCDVSAVPSSSQLGTPISKQSFLVLSNTCLQFTNIYNVSQTHWTKSGGQTNIGFWRLYGVWYHTNYTWYVKNAFGIIFIYNLKIWKLFCTFHLLTKGKKFKIKKTSHQDIFNF